MPRVRYQEAKRNYRMMCRSARQLRGEDYIADPKIPAFFKMSSRDIVDVRSRCMQVTVTGDGDDRTLTRVSVYSLVAVYPSMVITSFMATNPLVVAVYPTTIMNPLMVMSPSGL